MTKRPNLKCLSSLRSNKLCRLTPEHTSYFLWKGRVENLLENLPQTKVFDLIVTSPPYNLGKDYEKKVYIDEYLDWQKEIITKLDSYLKPQASVCWQVGNYVENGHIMPLDILIHPIFSKLGFRLRNRIIWKFGHGLHAKRRFSGRYEVILWYTRGDQYTFNLDSVRIPSKYPSKRCYKGPNVGEYSGNPLGKNPEDVWDIPNVKSNHVEKTNHPCQFPVGLVERLILCLTNEGDLVFDPFSGVGSSGVAAAIHNRKFWGAEVLASYISIAKARIRNALNGKVKYRSHSQPIYDHKASKLSILPTGFRSYDNTILNDMIEKARCVSNP